MAQDIQSQAYQLLKSAWGRPEPERESFILANAAQPEVAAAAIRMLRSAVDVEALAPPEVVVLPESFRNREGSLVNEWHIEKLLGSGGFGCVYRGWRRVPGGEEEVAIKFLDMALTEMPRFLRERQTLADLDHEGVCKFIDGGSTPGGIPYMVMEYVTGRPITRYCDFHRRSITERLKLFVKLCHAVEYAHEHRVLHRDLKPANILVTAAGAVRVLDFGVARLLDPASGISECLTKEGVFPWTKAYAAPEQINGGELSFATDVYALGVILYELVTGLLPFSESALSGPDWMRVVAELEPLPPSQAILIEAVESNGQSKHLLETAANLRGGSPSRLRRVLSGNLDAVILKTLRKDPESRYTRVERLRLDVERFLDGLPVTARRSGFWERASNWSARNRVTAIALVVSSLWTVAEFGLRFPQLIEYKAALHGEEESVQRLQYLTGTGFQSMEQALPRVPESREARLLMAQIHTRILNRVAALPMHVVEDLDSSLGVSALLCGREWKDLGDPRAGLEVTAPVLPLVAKRYELDRSDLSRKRMYSEFLRARMEMHALLHQDDEAAADAWSLSEIETRGR
ncbi:MAG: serine/threonine-protein kinase [Ignavibacteriota bacterium]